jgi:hypothetical protein
VQDFFYWISKQPKPLPLQQPGTALYNIRNQLEPEAHASAAVPAKAS